ncbi:MAG: hypothetical protein ACOY90_10950 [Candidatus Zhuqueibacterota bacterium]
MKILNAYLFLWLMLWLNCDMKNAYEPEQYSANAKITKWFGNCRAAISLTYDHGNPMSDSNIMLQNYLLSQNMTIDYEIVTSYYLCHPELKDYLLNYLIPSGFGYYGHGHWHFDHDALSYEEKLNSFSLCYQTLISWNLKPIAYAYPASGGLKNETQNALHEAGFLSGRMHFFKGMNKPWIIPDSLSEPQNWYQLPSVVMQDLSYANNEECVNDNNELVPILDQAIASRAWLILAYHSIGEENGYGFFKWDEFVKNVESIKSRDFWVASMNDINLYILEKNKTKIDLLISKNIQGKIETLTLMLSDELDNNFYSQPLTIELTIPEYWINKEMIISNQGGYKQTQIFNRCNVLISLPPDEKSYCLKLAE